MSNFNTNRLPRHNTTLHGSSKSLWDMKSRLGDGPARKFQSIYGSSVLLSPSGTYLSGFGAERRPNKKHFPYGISAKNRIRHLTRFRLSCDNVANERDRSYPQRSNLPSVPSEGDLFINVRFNTINCPQQSKRSLRSYSASTLLNPDRSHNLKRFGISKGGKYYFFSRSSVKLVEVGV